MRTTDQVRRVAGLAQMPPSGKGHLPSSVLCVGQNASKCSFSVSDGISGGSKSTRVLWWLVGGQSAEPQAWRSSPISRLFCDSLAMLHCNSVTT